MTFEGIVARKRAEQAANEWIKGYDYLCYEGKTGGTFIISGISHYQVIVFDVCNNHHVIYI